MRSAWTRTILRTPHNATGSSITRDLIMTGGRHRSDVAKSVSGARRCAVLGTVGVVNSLDLAG